MTNRYFGAQGGNSWTGSHVTLTPLGSWEPLNQNEVVDPAANDSPLVFNVNRTKPYVREGGREKSIDSGGSVDMVLSDGANSPGPDGSHSGRQSNRNYGRGGNHMRQDAFQSRWNPGITSYPNQGNWNQMSMMNVMMTSDPSQAISMMQGYGCGWGDSGAMGGNLMGSMGGPMPPWITGGPFNAEDFHPNEPMTLKTCTILPRKPGLPIPSTRDRPEGCRTIFVGGVPEWVPENVLRDVFDFCGEIESIRLSKKNFCHIRFKSFEAVDRAVSVSGAHVKVNADLVPATEPDEPSGGDVVETDDDIVVLDGAPAEAPKKKNRDLRNPFRVHVDYAAARDDKYDWECLQRAMAREERHRQREIETASRGPSPPPPSHYSDAEATSLTEQLKGEGGAHVFSRSCQTLLNWLERGDVNKRNANNFYTLLQSVQSYLRNLVKEKAHHQEEVVHTREMLRQKLYLIISQFDQIVDVFTKAKAQKSWDHFTKAQRKNIAEWKKLADELKAKNSDDVLKERVEDEMEMSDGDEGDKDTTSSQPPTKKVRRTELPASNELTNIKEENDQLKCQVDAYENENELLKAEFKAYKEAKEKEGKMMQNMIMGLKDQLMGAKSEAKKEAEEYKKQLEKEFPEKIKTLQNTVEEFVKITVQENSDEKDAALNELRQKLTSLLNEKFKETSEESKQKDIVEQGPAATVVTEPKVAKLDGKIAHIIGVVACFLNVHPNGASMQYIWSYLKQMENLTLGLRCFDVESTVLEGHPGIFQRRNSGVGACIEDRWIFVGFSDKQLE